MNFGTIYKHYINELFNRSALFDDDLRIINRKLFVEKNVVTPFLRRKKTVKEYVDIFNDSRPSTKCPYLLYEDYAFDNGILDIRLFKIAKYAFLLFELKEELRYLLILDQIADEIQISNQTASKINEIESLYKDLTMNYF